MPWYWTDDLARVLVSKGTIPERIAAEISATPVAIRRTEDTLEAAAYGYLDDDEIPLAA